MFSKLLDISGFFLIVIINLSLIALLCYYAKKKFESIEEIQREQSKVLFDLVNKSTSSSGSSNSGIDPMFLSVTSSPVIEVQDVTNTVKEEPKIISYDLDKNMSMVDGDESESDSDSGPDTDSDDESDSDEEEEELSDDEKEYENIEKITVNLNNHDEQKQESDEDVQESQEEVEENQEETEEEVEEEYNVNLDKMTISELKQYIEKKGGKLNSKTTKKNDILEYIKTNSL